MSSNPILIKANRLVPAADKIIGPSSGDRALAAALENRARSLLAEAEAVALSIKTAAAAEVEAAKAEAEAAAGAALAAAISAGRAEGYQAGLAAAQAEAEAILAAARGDADQILSAAHAAKTAIEAEAVTEAHSRQRELEPQLIELALAIARHILRSEVTTRPETVAEMARAALLRLQNSDSLKVRTHPDARAVLAGAVTDLSGGSDVDLVTDAGLAPGDFILTSGHGTIDGRIESQLSQIAAQLGVPPIADR